MNSVHLTRNNAHVVVVVVVHLVVSKRRRGVDDVRTHLAGRPCSVLTRDHSASDGMATVIPTLLLALQKVSCATYYWQCQNMSKQYYPTTTVPF